MQLQSTRRQPSQQEDHPLDGTRRSAELELDLVTLLWGCGPVDREKQPKPPSVLGLDK